MNCVESLPLCIKKQSRLPGVTLENFLLFHICGKVFFGEFYILQELEEYINYVQRRGGRIAIEFMLNQVFNRSHNIPEACYSQSITCYRQMLIRTLIFVSFTVGEMSVMTSKNSTLIFFFKNYIFKSFIYVQFLCNGSTVQHSQYLKQFVSIKQIITYISSLFFAKHNFH